MAKEVLERESAVEEVSSASSPESDSPNEVERDIRRVRADASVDQSAPTEAMHETRLAFAIGSRLRRAIERVRGWNAALALRPWVSAGLVFVAALALGIAGAAGVGFPEPVVHDEFSYLLGADTFVHGRLTNPPHPLAEHFQTFHVLQHPTYASKYPPGQALVLAVGIELGGRPIIGVWLSFALMCAAVYWMLRAWIGPRWALVGALGLAMRLATTYWVYQYWGGAVAALGGALVLGGAYRVVTGGRPRDAVLMALGAGILGVTRPYEGLLLCVPVAAVVLAWLIWRPRRVPGVASGRHRLRSVVLPAVAVLAVFAAFTLRYNQAVTGDATRFPYLAYLQEYGRGPDFVWQQPRDVPLPENRLVRTYQLWELATADSLRSPAGFVSRNGERLKLTVGFFLPMFLLAPLFALPLALRSRWVRLALVCLVVVGIGLAVSSWYQPHYAAPATALFVTLYFSCLAWCRRLRVGRFDAGIYLVSIILVAWAGTQLAKLALPIARVVRSGATPEEFAWGKRRAAIERRLRSTDDKDVVIVRYGPKHSFHHEWVYNGADIDGSEVVWAHDLGPAKNANLMSYFRDRAVWLLEVSDDSTEDRLSRIGVRVQ